MKNWKTASRCASSSSFGGTSWAKSLFLSAILVYVSAFSQNRGKARVCIRKKFVFVRYGVTIYVDLGVWNMEGYQNGSDLYSKHLWVLKHLLLCVVLTALARWRY